MEAGQLVPGARALMQAAAPVWSGGHVLRSPQDTAGLVFLTDQSRLYRLSGASWMEAEQCHRRADAHGLDNWERSAGLEQVTRPALPLSLPRIHALSLAISQKCNLGCVYCYAQEGGFGAPTTLMSQETAFAAVDRLLDGAGPGDTVQLSFLGGEPLANRLVIRAATEYAASRAAAQQVKISLAITTNGTMLTPEDGEFFERHGFAVTVSLDGIGETHDRLRPSKDGRPSYHRILERVRPLLKLQRAMQVSARATVTPANLQLRETLDEFIDLGFHSVGFSPMLASPTGHGEMGRSDLELMLVEMVCCGTAFERAICEGRRYPFQNMVNAMREIHAGSHRPLPCGAGAGYLGVGADGALSACHRFVNDPAGAMGSLDRGVDDAGRAAWMHERQVDRQEPCRACWARYLCGGGCHHEVIHRGRVACDFIRGWLHYCLQAYARLMDSCPVYFDEGKTPAV